MDKNRFQSNPSYKVIDHLYDERKDFIILGLCGRVGSGVSTVSSILEKSFPELQLPEPGFSGLDLYENHEYRILYTYAKQNWKAFYKIRTSALITRRTLSEEYQRLADFLLSLYEGRDSNNEVRGKIEDLAKKFFDEEMVVDLNTYCVKLGLEKVENVNQASIYITNDLPVLELREKFKSSNGNTVNSKNSKRIKMFKDIELRIRKEKDDCNKIVITITNKTLSKLLDKYSLFRKEKSGFKNPILYFILQQYVYDFLPKEASEFWQKIGKISKRLPTQALQYIGNNLRMSKKPYFDSKFVEDGYVCLAEDINLAIKILRAFQLKIQESKIGSDGTQLYTPHKDKDCDRAVVVIDSIKNPYESLYLKSRYSNYYLIGIYTDDAERKKRLREHERLVDDDIKAIDIIEQNSEFKKKIEKYIDKQKEIDKQKKINKNKNKKTNKQNENKDEYEIPSIVIKMYEQLKDKGIVSNLTYIAPFVLQNVSSCLDAADILINNRPDNSSYLYLKKVLLRYVTLIMNPGMILPTAIERCMQIANTAKLNSGCISRQVGAVLTDKEYHLLSVGWNQQPEGQIPCSYRDICELYHHWSTDTYSDYENDDNKKFQNAIQKQVECIFDTDNSPLADKGKLPHYCFKDYHNKLEHKNNQVHTRALHAEETAFLNLGPNNGKIFGGVLFTTSSPCELCAKKAMYLGVATIYYIESYAGVSKEHVLNIGDQKKRPDLVLFTGAIGMAYTKLYTPLLPLKDENEMWLGQKMDAELFEHIEKSGKED